MSERFVNNSSITPSSDIPPTDSLSTNSSNYNTTVETPGFQPRPIYVFIIWFVFGIFGNCTAIAIIIRNRKKHHWRIFYRLVFMLAMSDLTGQLLTIPIMFATYANREVLMTGKLCHFMSTITIMTSLISVLLVCIMSIDRLIASWFPILYRNKVTIRHMYVGIVCVIALAFCVGLLPTVGINTHMIQKEGTWCFVDLHPTKPKDQVFLYLSASIGMAAVLSMLIMNGMVVYRLCHVYKKKTRPKSMISTPSSYNSGVKNVQNICFLIIIMIVFISSWSPVIVRFFVNAAGSAVIDHDKDKNAVALAVMHQVLNPWIYIIMQECLFSRCLKYGRKHSKQGSIFHQILADYETKQTETTTYRY